LAEYQNPELLDLFKAYAAHDTSIGVDFRALASKEAANDPLIVATSTDMALYPGSGRPPSVLPFRKSTRGFNELAGVSHLGPAVGSLMVMRAKGDAAWRPDAQMLRQKIAAARAANSAQLWTDSIAVEAYRGREAAIAALLDYGCAVTDRVLAAALADEDRFTAEFVRAAYLEATSDVIGATIPFNHVMIATFFLVGMDIAYRTNVWLKTHGIDWSRAMVLVAGQQGRPTAGVTLWSNSIAQIVLAASDRALALNRIYIAPHAPTFGARTDDSLAAVAALEKPLRDLWSFTHSVQSLAGAMFEGYARYDPTSVAQPRLQPDTDRLAEMPAIDDPNDMHAMTTRLRLVMEDPRQLLSGCVTDFAAEQLRRHGNDVSRVVVPALDGVDYPRLAASAEQAPL
jgi:hypothetical protein